MKLSERNASTICGIPRSTIQNKMKQKTLGKVELKLVFTDSKHICSCKFPLDMLDLRLLIKGRFTKSGSTTLF